MDPSSQEFRDSLGLALGLESQTMVNSFLQQVYAKEKEDTQNKTQAPLRIYEHDKKANTFTVHSHDVELAARLGIEDLHSIEYLYYHDQGASPPRSSQLKNNNNQPSNSLPPLPTLRLSFRSCRDFVTRALTVAGKKVQLLLRTSSSSQGKGSNSERVVIQTKLNASPGDVTELENEWNLDTGAILAGADTDHNHAGAGNHAAAPEACGMGSALLGASTVLAVKVTRVPGGAKVGVASWDPAASAAKVVFRVAQFDDDEALPALESALVATNAKEVLLCLADYDSQHSRAKIADILLACGCARTDKDKQYFQAGYQLEQDLIRLTDSKFDTIRFWDLDNAMSALAALIRFSKAAVLNGIDGKIEISPLDLNSCMKLDAAAMRALNVFPQVNDGIGKRNSLFGLINKTKTEMGSRTLKRWLSQPLLNCDEINRRLDLVQELMNHDQVRVTLREDHFRRIPDLNVLSRKFQKNSRSSLHDVIRLYQFALRLPFIVDVIQKANQQGDDDTALTLLKAMFAQPLSKICTELSNFEALVETTVDLEQIDNHEYVINPAIDSDLAELKEQKDKILNQISLCYENVRKALGVKDDKLKLEKKDNLGYYLRLTRKDEKLIRGKSKYLIIETRKDGVRFVTSELRKYSEQYTSLSESYNDKQDILMKKTIEVVATYVPVFEDAANLIGDLDVLSGFAAVAMEAPNAYCRPQIVKEGSGYVIKKGRHPMVEVNMEGVPFIPNDIDTRRIPSVNQNESEEAGGALLIVTGPNMGGKSTFIRQVGVISIMAHVGCFVPAEEAQIPITDRILARVGAGDNQLRGISTFMAEMLETAAILKSATCNSLVIIDELGRGTSTYDGFGLAYAISEHIAQNIKSSCLFATHFHELTALEHALPGIVRNLHVTAVTSDTGERKLVFLYEVRPGSCDQSFGIHVAEMAKFPERVIAEAKRKAYELEIEETGHGNKFEDIPADCRQEGMEMMKMFLDEIRGMEFKEEQSQEIVEKVRGMKRRLVESNNEYVHRVLSL